MNAVRELYRRLASEIHPDRATGPLDAHRRTAWMKRANRAKDSGDLHALMDLERELHAPPPTQDKPALPRAEDINIWTLKRCVMTQDGWVCPP